ncbi:MAG TPA: 4'-phosphopantetheinyl transferase superfamily protein [Fluviicola sp.]|nr:4'-phosphopantetheinyl transferase superfamily protein [Fluviicola sp.]
MNWILEPELIAVRLDRKPDVLEFETLLNCISTEKKAAIRKYHREEDKLRSLVGELLVRMILIRRCGMNNEAISFVYTENGKPLLAGAENLHFNVAHAGDWVVCAFDSQPVGVDIEQIKPANLAISRSFFTEAEDLDICSATDPNDRFFDYWTLKESFIKQTGNGLSLGINSFGVVFTGDDIRIVRDGSLLDGYYLRQYIPADGYKVAVCLDNASFPETISVMGSNRLARFFKAE